MKSWGMFLPSIAAKTLFASWLGSKDADEDETMHEFNAFVLVFFSPNACIAKFAFGKFCRVDGPGEQWLKKKYLKDLSAN